jgi:hypothetical protein
MAQAGDSVSIWRLRSGRSIPGPASVGMMHEIIDDQRRAVIEIIVEEKTGNRDPKIGMATYPTSRIPEPG